MVVGVQGAAGYSTKPGFRLFRAQGVQDGLGSRRVLPQDTILRPKWYDYMRDTSTPTKVVTRPEILRKLSQWLAAALLA